MQVCTHHCPGPASILGGVKPAGTGVSQHGGMGLRLSSSSSDNPPLGTAQANPKPLAEPYIRQLFACPCTGAGLTVGACALPSCPSAACTGVAATRTALVAATSTATSDRRRPGSAEVKNWRRGRVIFMETTA